MFKFKFVLIVFCMFVSFYTKAGSDTSAVKGEVLLAFQSLVKAAKALDSDGYFKHFDKEKFVGLNSDGTNWNSISDLEPLIINGFKAIDSVTILHFSNVVVSVLDSYTAVLVNEYAQTMQLNNGEIVKVAGGGSQVWSKRSGIWKIVSISSSNKPN